MRVDNFLTELTLNRGLELKSPDKSFMLTEKQLPAGNLHKLVFLSQDNEGGFSILRFPYLRLSLK